MNEVQVMECDVATLEDKVLKEAYIDYVPKLEKKCREVKKEVKERIKKNGELEGLKIFKESAGVTVDDKEAMYHAINDKADLIAAEEFKSCLTLNMTALKKILIPRMQEKALEKGEKISKQECDAWIINEAKECGTEKTKEVIM